MSLDEVSVEVAVLNREVWDLQDFTSLKSFSQFLPPLSHDRLPEFEETIGAAVGGDHLQDAGSSELSLLGHPNGVDLDELHHLLGDLRVLHYRPSSTGRKKTTTHMKHKPLFD